MARDREKPLYAAQVQVQVRDRGEVTVLPVADLSALAAEITGMMPEDGRVPGPVR